MSEGVYLMVISPHPDDCEFGTAGTAAKLSREGKKVVYVICTNGDKGSSDPKMTSPRLAKIREKEQKAAADIVGVSEVVFLRFPDQGLEDSYEFRKALVREIRRFKPFVVATSDPYRKYMWHRDHRMAGQVAADAVFPYSRDHLAYPDLLQQGFEPHKTREMWFWGTEEPNLRIDITDTFDIKIKALSCHKSQFDVNDQMIEHVREMSTMSAKGEKFKLAKAFHRVELRQ